MKHSRQHNLGELTYSKQTAFAFDIEAGGTDGSQLVQLYSEISDSLPAPSRFLPPNALLNINLSPLNWLTHEFISDKGPDEKFLLRFYQALWPLKDTWQKLESEGVSYAFQNYHWIDNWLRTTKEGENIQACPVVLETHQGEALLILPLGIQTIGRTKCLIWLGGEFADYQTALFSNAVFDQLSNKDFKMLWKSICAAFHDIDAIALERQPAMLNGVENPFLFRGSKPHPCSAHSAMLNCSLTEFVNGKRSRSWRKKERRCERRLAEIGRVHFKVAQTESDMQEMLDTLIHQKSASYKIVGARDPLSSYGYDRFVRRLTTNTLANGFTHLCGLYVGERLAATAWGLVYQNRYYYLLPAYERDELSRYSPGNLLLRHVFEWCMDNGIEVFDFTAGDENYKTHWSDKSLTLHDYFSASSLRGLIYVSQVHFKRSAKRLIKNSPRLFSAAKQLRLFWNYRLRESWGRARP
jgi:CelD/BcsL family acetyltransferase involved in cellulose biosynthesis